MKTEEDNRLHNRVEQQAKRLQQAERERSTLLAQTVYLGTLGLVFVLPVIAGAYLGAWLDDQLTGYSMGWTLSLIFLGLVVGAINVWLMIRE
ncbi:MAG: AtpZ/AtpI family protein [Chromatiales bacterium]|jgi:ATP synthase protein I